MIYTGVDLDRYNRGDRFLSQDRFLANYNPRDAITFNVTPNIDTGIMSQVPVPIIPQEGGDGGPGFNPNRADPNFDYETEAYGVSNYSPEEKGITEEQQALLDQMRFGKALTPMQLVSIGLNPIGGGIRAFFKNRQQKREAEKQLTELAALENARDMAEANRAAGTGGYQAGYDDDFMTGGDSQRDEAQEERSPGSSGPGGSDTMGSSKDGGIIGYGGTSGTPLYQQFMDGGRIGYSNGGLSTYEIFKLGELGFDTKGGTVTAPFGGIKVLRDILKVNQYAGGGIVGLYR